MNVTKSRSFVKALTWRTTGTLDTFLISLLITKKPFIAASIASVEVLTKIVLYYFHERIWNKVKWGRVVDNKSNK
jgi:uncharacterized membrane protein